MARQLGRFDHWSTGTKLLLILTAALLPLGLALAWSTRETIVQSNHAVADVADLQGRNAARAIESMIARNALALRVAASGSIRAGRDPCREAALALALTPGVVPRFAMRNETGKRLCADGDVPVRRMALNPAPGALAIWVSPDDRALFFRVGVVGGNATGIITAEEFAAAVHDVQARVERLSIADRSLAGRPIDVVGSGDVGSDLRPADYRIANGRLVVRTAAPVHGPSLAERMTVLLPLLMLVIAVISSWLLVRHLLLVPLGRLRRAVNEYRPGSDRLVLPERMGSAEEINALGDAFERAVDRIEQSEVEMAEALEGQRRLVREVHHRVKNNLQVIASMLAIHGRSAMTPESRAAYASIGRRVDALSVVHRNHFAEGEQSRGLLLRPILVELSEILRASAADAKSRPSIHLDVASMMTTQDAAVAVSFFMTEVAEYSMLQAPQATIHVELRRLSELAARLTIASDALLPAAHGVESTAYEQFMRVVGGLARQLRSPLESRPGQLGVTLPVFPDQ